MVVREEASIGEYGLYYSKSTFEGEDEGEEPYKNHVVPQHRQFLGQKV